MRTRLIRSTARQWTYALFVVEMLKRDRSGPQSLSDDSLAKMLTRTTKVECRSNTGTNGERSAQPTWYGLGWAIIPTPAGDRIHHSGSNDTGFRCDAEFDPRSGNGIVIMTNSANGAGLLGETSLKRSGRRSDDRDGLNPVHARIHSADRSEASARNGLKRAASVNSSATQSWSIDHLALSANCSALGAAAAAPSRQIASRTV